YLTTHHGGYDRFLVRLDSFRRDAENVIRLEVDNTATDDCPPGKPVKGLDFCYYSGLYREASLVICPPLHISDPLAVACPGGGGIFFRTISADRERAEVEVRVHIQHEVPVDRRFLLPQHYDEAHACQIHLLLKNSIGCVVAEHITDPVNLRMNCDHQFTEKFSVANPELWSPDHPALYSLECELIADGTTVDSQSIRCGIRHLTVNGKDGLKFNGAPFFINGTNRHQEYPHVGNAVPPSAQKRDAMLLKKGGRNFLRLAHYPQHQAFLDACDELGIAVVACIPGWQYYAVNDQFLAHLWRDVRSLIRDYRNHPCIVFWEVSMNETYPANWINAEANRIAHEEFPGDQCITCGDTYGLYEGWDVLFSRPGLQTDKPVLVREYGDWCFGQNQSTSRQTRGGGEKAMLQQAWNYIWCGNKLGKEPSVIGVADWAAWDYNRGYFPVTFHGGAGDMFRVPRYKYHFFRSQASDEPMVFPAAEWNREPGSSGNVVVFSNCEEVELLLNGRSVARRKADAGPDTPYSRAALNEKETAATTDLDASGGNPFDGGNAGYWPHPPFTFPGINYEPGELTVVGYIHGAPVVRESIFTGGKPEKLHLILREDGVPAQENDLLFAEVHLLDAQNHPAYGSETEVSLTVSGPAEIAGPAVKQTEGGIASFLIRTGAAGSIILRAESGGGLVAAELRKEN
ncbi:MAG: DUF4982 domain-containing protein, partial [Lentisphaeria bacterium]|nr:DUF4982 domain-containing protein [Lentisphaeria bacterium]